MGLGNALFIATSLAVIVGSASGGFAGAIVLYETALGVGIATGPLPGGLLGGISWRGPFRGVAVLMLIALVATAVLVPSTPGPRGPPPSVRRCARCATAGCAPPAWSGCSTTGGFFTLLGYAPFLMGLDALGLGAVFFAWGVLVAVFAVFGAPRLERRFGTAATLLGCLVLVAVVLAVIGMFPDRPGVVIAAVIASGALVGLNNTLVTTAVMSISPVPRPVAAAVVTGGALLLRTVADELDRDETDAPGLQGSADPAGAVATAAELRR